MINPLSVNPTKWSIKLKQFVCKLPRNCLGVFDHFVGWLLKGYVRGFFFKIKVMTKILEKNFRLAYSCGCRSFVSNFI